jgi:hypothetical protein
MFRTIVSSLFAGIMTLTFAAPAVSAAETRFFEMRTYYAPPGKLEELHARFRNHTVQLFEKHGMTNIGYWVPMENPDRKLIYLLAYPSREARDKAWKGFLNDPAWKAAHKASEVNGKLVDRIESVFLKATDYSPVPKPASAKTERVFELRTYKCAPGKLPNLNARFRDHTVRLFAQYGMTNLGYWTPTESKDGAEDTLIYLLAHQSRDAAAASFKAFAKDPAWAAAKKASEEKAGGSLTVPKGVQSLFLVATDYSPMK